MLLPSIHRMSSGKVAVVAAGAIAAASVTTSSGAQPPSAAATFSGAFTRGEIAATQCMDWNAFRASLTGTYSSITLAGSQDPAGRTCTGATASTLCRALHEGSAVSNVVCDGYVWNVDYCSDSSWELSADGTACNCAGSYDVRPCIGTNADWGGLRGPSCEYSGNQTQTISVTCR
jgi:hypothetical protein